MKNVPSPLPVGGCSLVGPQEMVKNGPGARIFYRATNTTPSWVKRAVKWLSRGSTQSELHRSRQLRAHSREWLIAPGSLGCGPHLRPVRGGFPPKLENDTKK